MKQKQDNFSGSAKHLSGDIYTLICFISENGESWANSKKTDTIELVKEALNWIERQANRYNQYLNLSEKGCFGLTDDIKFDTIEKGQGIGNERVDWVSKVLYKAGYKSTHDFFNWVKSSTTCNNAHVLIFAKGSGRSYSIAYSPGMDKELYFIEGTLIYEYNINGIPLHSATITHEILHLYGAEDLYANFLQTKRNELIAKVHFPDSIMLRVSKDLSSLNIDKLTAWFIGWNNNPEEWYESFCTKHNF